MACRHAQPSRWLALFVCLTCLACCSRMGHTADVAEKDVKAGKIDTAYVLDMTDEQIRDLIPARKPILTWAVFPLRGKVRWHPHKPKHITINGDMFIVEERFPPTKTFQVTGPDGTEWTYEYFEDRFGGRIYPTCHRDYAIRTWWVRVAGGLSRLYAEKGDKVAAHKAAVIIHRFARAYRGYPVYGVPGWRKPWQFFDKEPYPWVSGKWDRWYPFDMGESGQLAAAYERIRDSGAIEELSKALGCDVKKEIEEDFLADHCRLMMKYDTWNAKSIATRTFNHQPTKCLGMVNVGRALKQPEFVHYAYQNLKDIFALRFMVDGIFPESPSYHWLTANRMAQAIERLKGYSDPPGYTDKLTGKRFDDFDAAVEFPLLPRALAFLKECRYPDATRMVVHESNPTIDGKPRSKTTSRLFPAFGHGILGRGEGDGQMEAHLHFSKRFNHAQDDALHLILWACGEELLPDLGYNSETYRGWSTCSLAHNLVVVDGSTQQTNPSDATANPDAAVGGQIVSWFPQEKGFGVVEASAQNSYPQCSEYRRCIMMVGADPKHAFVVDVFSVAGGKQHDWMAHGSCDREQDLVLDKPSTPHADSLAADGKIHVPMTSIEERTKGLRCQFDKYGKVSQYWGNIRHVNKVDGPGPWMADMRGKGKDDAKLRLHLLAPTDSTLYTGEAPSTRRANGDPNVVEKYMMPILTARRKGEELRGLFVAVWEPYRDMPWLSSVRLLKQTDDAIAVEATAGTTRFTVFWANRPDAVIDTGRIRFEGRYACVQEEDNKARVHLCEGTHLTIGNREIRAEAEETFDILSATAVKGMELLVVRGAAEAGNVVGRWGILLHPGGETRAAKLGKVERIGENTRIECPEGLGLAGSAEEQSWRETCFPLRTFKGQMRLRLPLRVDAEIDLR